jgi:hypothetical protein
MGKDLFSTLMEEGVKNKSDHLYRLSACVLIDEN